MGKRRDMATIQLEQLRQFDHAVFGHMVIARQSTAQIKEASMFVEKPVPGKRKLEKAKSDKAVVLQKQSVYQKSRSFISEIQEQKHRTTNHLKCNENHLKDGQNVRNTLNRNWHSAEFPTMAEQRKVAGDCLGRTPDPLTIPASVNGQRSFHFSVSKNSSLAPSVSRESVSDGYRHLQPSKRKSLPFHGSLSLSRESSIEEETEVNDDSISSVNCKEPKNECEKGSRLHVCQLVDELLLDIYGKWYGNGPGLSFGRRRHSANSSAQESDCCSTSGASMSCKFQTPHSVKGTNDSLQQSRLRNKSVPELQALLATLRSDVHYAGSLLVRELKRRDALVSRREKQNDMITAFLQAVSEKRSQDTRIRFSVMPYPGDSGFTQWHDAMKMVARLPGGIPQEFRRRLWLTVAEKHLQSRGVDWSHAERLCFNEWSNPDDDELGVQIVKDLHRTGCSLFCGAAAEENQALLKRVLLAYARWNKAVGYCQGFNMLAALILQVMDRSESDSVKVMIYLIEGVLPESYFANNLRGLSVDMAVFRDLLRLRLPTLSRHLEQLQHDARDSATGTSYEPPLTNVFTMQWFLTLFSNCLPQSTVLRVWDLIFLEGNEVLLRTALAIWDGLADRIMAVNSADEFYSIMGVLTREMLEFGLMDTNNLIKTIVTIAPFPFPELPELRDKYLYNITPWTQTVSTAARRGLRLFYSDDDEDDGTDEDDEKIAVAAAYGISAVFRSPRRRDSMNRAPSPSSSLSAISYSPATADRDRLALDISALKQQYAKLRERQRQAHIILTAACARQPLGPSVPTPIAMNHLLLGKNALLSVRGRRSGPPSGAVPPPASTALKSVHKPQRRSQQLHITAQGQLITASHTEVVSPQIQQQQAAKLSGETLHWKDTTQKKQRKGSKQDATIVQSTPSADAEKTQGIRHKTTMSREVPLNKELELTTENDTESDDSKSSTSTELCDEPGQLSDFDSEEPTSISETSVQVLSTGEASITKLPSTSPIDNSGLSTSLLVANDLLPLKSLRNALTPSKSRECFVFESKPVPPSEKFTDNILKSSLSMDTSQVTCSRESHLGPEDDNAKHTSSEKTESAAKIDASCVFKQSSSTEKKSPFSSEFFVPFHTSKLKVITSEGINNHDTISKESNDSNCDFCTEQSVENVSEICGIAVSKTHLAQQHITYSSPSEVPHPENKMEEEMSKIPTDLKFVKFTDNCKEESISVPEITQQNHWGTVEPLKYLITETLQYLQDTQYIAPTSLPSGNLSPIAPIRMLQDDVPTTAEKEDIQDSDVEPTEELKADIRIDCICTERSLPEFHRSVVPFSSMPKCGTADNDHDEKADTLKTLKSEEDRCVSVGENEDISKLLQLNLTLQDRKQVMKEGDQACEVRNIANLEITETHNAEMSEVLEISQNIHLGRRNSENALKIIQENSEILQRILHCQVRRPSKLSEEESNDSNLPSIPTSSSPENSDITPSQQAVSGKMKTVSSDTCIQTVLSPKDDVSVKLASEGSLNLPISIHSLPKCDKAIKSITDHPQSEEGVSVESKMLHLEKEHVQEPTAEHFDSHCSSIPAIPVDFLKEHEFCKPKQEEKHAPSLGSDWSLSLSQEISNEKPPRFSAGFHILKTETEISDNVIEVPDPSDKQSLSQSEDATMSNLTGSSVYSSFPLCENIHHMESRAHGTTEAELDRKQTSTMQFDWKRLQALDSNLDGNISSKLPKHYSPQATTHTSYSSYSSKVVKENLQVQDPPIVPVTQAEGIISAKWTDNDDGDIRIDKNFIMTERTSSDLQFHIDTSFPKPSSDSSSSSWFTEKCTLKDGSSATKSTCESHKLSYPSSCYSTCSSDFSTSEHEYSPARTKSWCTEDRSDYFQHNSTKHTESLPSWYTKHSTTRPSDSFILTSSSDRTEISPRGDYLQKSSYSSTQGFREDFHYSFRPNATSTLDLNSETQDVTSRKSTRDQSRPHSTIISDVASTTVLNRSYSSSSIDGYLTRIRPGLSSPANSSNQEHHPFFKSESDISSSQALDKHTTTVYNPTYEIENSMKVPATAEYRHSTKPPRRNESEPKHSAEDLSPPNYSSFPHSRCDKDKPLSPMKSEYRKENFDPNNLSTESPLVTPSLSATKVGISHSNSLSPTKSKNIYVSLPPLKTSNLGSPTRSKSKFDPFPPRPTMRQPRELGIKLGLYSSDCANKNVKATNKKT